MGFASASSSNALSGLGIHLIQKTEVYYRHISMLTSSDVHMADSLAIDRLCVGAGMHCVHGTVFISTSSIIPYYVQSLVVT